YVQANCKRIKAIDISGTDPWGIVRVQFIDPPRTPDRGQNDTSVLTTARDQQLVGCIACASSRPQLYTEHAPLYPSDMWGYACMLALTREATPTNYTTLASIFTTVYNKTKPGPFSPQKGEGAYVCFNFTGTGRPLGEIPPDWCNATVWNGTSNVTIGSWVWSGLYFYCGAQRLLTRVPPGVRAMVWLGAPLVLIGERPVRLNATSAGSITQTRRRQILSRRSTHNFDPTANSPTYIDTIGVPRGVPNEFKLADQVAAGFENIPIVAALFPITLNKNVDLINYEHYNVLRLSNLTRDAIEGLPEQLGPTSLMAVQNRMALDMLLAERGDACAMFGDVCCTFIPNNTAPDGSITKALEGLKTLSKTMHEHSGINSIWDGWMVSMFGQWKGLMSSLLLSLATFAAILVTCGCCCIPCLRALLPHMMPLLALPDGEEELGEEDFRHK
uniref:Uncharacterized protein n=1 Tax=Paramormyrops kingsleyae TaxID=1676925 RepID=A0A3B3TAJ0_9TELE